MVIFTTSRGWLNAESTTYGMLLALATRGIHNLAIYRAAKLPGLQVLAIHGDYTMCEQTYRLKPKHRWPSSRSSRGSGPTSEARSPRHPGTRRRRIRLASRNRSRGSSTRTNPGAALLATGSIRQKGAVSHALFAENNGPSTVSWAFSITSAAHSCTSPGYFAGFDAMMRALSKLAAVYPS